jgi:hypothetical protein
MYKALLMIAGAVALAYAGDNKSAELAEAADHADSLGMAETRSQGHRGWVAYYRRKYLASR